MSIEPVMPSNYLIQARTLEWGHFLMGKQWKQCRTLFFRALKSLQMVTAAMKLKDAYSLDARRGLRPTRPGIGRAWGLNREQLYDPMASQSFTISQSLLKLLSVESVMSSSHLILCHPLLLLPSVFPSIRAFPMNQFFASGSKVLEPQLQHQSFQ